MSHICKAVLLAATAFGCVAGLSPAANAAGFYLEDQSAKGAGRAYSGEAADQGPDSLWWNPASIAGATGLQMSFGLSGIMPSSKVNDTGSLIVRPGQAPAPVGGASSDSNPISDGLLPNGAFAMPLNDRLAIGVAITSPYSFATKYGSDSWARYTAATTKLETVDIQPSAAYKVNQWLNIGVGINAEYTDATLSNALPNLLAAWPDGRETLTGNGWDFGWSAGAQAHNETFTVGISYKSSIKHDLSGAVNISGLLGPLAANNVSVGGVKANFDTPSQAIFGVRAKVNDKLTLDAQAVSFGWSKFSDIAIGAPFNSAMPENYKDTWSLAFGGDYLLNDKWTLRAGLQYDETPTRDGQRDARVPDANRWNFAAGASYKLTPKFTVDAGVTYVDFAKASIDRVTAAYAGTPVQTPILPSGTINNANAVVVAVGGRITF